MWRVRTFSFTDWATIARRRPNESICGLARDGHNKKSIWCRREGLR